MACQLTDASSGRGGGGGGEGRAGGRVASRALYALGATIRFVHAVAVLAAAIVLVVVGSVPLTSLQPQLQVGGALHSSSAPPPPLPSHLPQPTQPLVPMWASHLYHHTAPFQLSSGYGLFRRMTGVGRSSPRHTDDDDDAVSSWAPLPVSVVARPEIGE